MSTAVVSKMTSAVAAQLSRVLPWVEHRAGSGDVLRQALVQGDAAVARAAQQSQTARAGTTLTAAYISMPTLHVARIR